MHGRLKVRTTEEQQEAKRKEREKKQKIYTAATQRAFQKRENKEYDEEALKITGEILSVNPDFYSLWNFRKEIFLYFKEVKPTEELNKIFEDELYFLESCLKVNPKSYGTWHHRCFVMTIMPSPDWHRELQLCNKFLEYDERNFHCWDYRRFVVKTSNVPDKEEFDFTTAKIASNFSNYSSWHYRSKLLPHLYPDSHHSSGVQEDILLQEFETVQNAFFTDPNDQSSWFYHRWLLGRGCKELDIDMVYISRQKACILVTFTKPILIDRKNNISLVINGKDMEGDWLNPRQQIRYSTLWKLENINIPEGEVEIKISLNDDKIEQLLHLSESNIETWYNAPFKHGNRFSYELSSATSETLNRELTAIQELYEIEPDNKWVILTIMSLMKALDSIKYEEEILQHVKSLQELDPKRKTYYQDLRSKVLVENVLEKLEPNQKCLDLSNKGLSVLYHTELLPLVTELDLNGNQLKSVNNLEYLQCVEKLVLDNNNICDITGIDCLHHLQHLSLKNNSIKNVEQLQPLQLCKNLQYLDIQDNPICVDSVDLDTLKERLPNVKIVFQ